MNPCSKYVAIACFALTAAACASTSDEEVVVATPASAVSTQADDFPDGPAPSPARARCYESCGRRFRANYDLWLRCCVKCDDTVALDPDGSGGPELPAPIVK